MGSEPEFIGASGHAITYTMADHARYVWTTSEITDEYYFETPARKLNAFIPCPDIPHYGISNLARLSFAKGLREANNGQKLFPLETVAKDDLTHRFQQTRRRIYRRRRPPV